MYNFPERWAWLLCLGPYHQKTMGISQFIFKLMIVSPARALALCFLLHALWGAHCAFPTLFNLLESEACTTNITTGSIICVVEGTLLLSGLDSPLSQPLTLRANSGSGGFIVIQPASPLVIARKGSLTLLGVTVNGVAFSQLPLNPALSLAWSGITLQPGAQLTVTSSMLALDCPTWTSLLSAVCDFGQAPGDSQVRRGGGPTRYLPSSMHVQFASFGLEAGKHFGLLLLITT